MRKFINTLSVITFAIGLMMADSENLLIPVIVLLIAGVSYKLTEEN